MYSTNMKKLIYIAVFILLSTIAKSQTIVNGNGEQQSFSATKGVTTDTLLRGGHQVGFADTNARNAIPLGRRRIQMGVYTLNTHGTDGIRTCWELQTLSANNGSNWNIIYQVISSIITFNGFNSLGQYPTTLTKTAGGSSSASALLVNTYAPSGTVDNLADLQATNSVSGENNIYTIQGVTPATGAGNNHYFFSLPNLGGQFINNSTLNGNFYPAYLTSLKMDSLLTVAGTQWSIVWDSVSHVFKKGKISGGGGSGVSSFKGRIGAVIPVAGDYAALTETLTNKNLISGTNTFPTFNQNTTGNAASATNLQTSRLIQGVSFNGTSDINPINGTGFVKVTGTTLSYDNSTYLTTSTATSTYVPYTGASGNVNLNTQTLEAGQFGIGTGTTTPIGKLQTVETSTSIPRGVLFDQYSTDASGSKLSLRKARGTFGSPTTVVTGDNLGGFNGTAFDGTNFIDASRFLTSVTGTVSTGITPGIMSFQNQNATGALVTGMQMTSDSIHAYIPLNIKSLDGYKAVMQRSSTSTGFSLSNATIGVSGPGNALGFNSAMSQYFQFSDTSLPTGNFTGSFICWIKRTGSNTGLLTYGTNAVGELMIIQINATSVVYYNGSSNTTFSTSAFALNTYHHLAITIAAGTIKCYVDGSLVGTQTAVINIVKSGTGLASNYSPLLGYPDGIIDQYAFYSGTALSATDVTNIYNSGAATATLPGSPLIRFDLDDGTPNTTLVNTGTATSSNGTTFNSPPWQGFGNGKVPIVGSSIPSLNPVIRSVNGVNQSESGQNFFGLNSAASILTGLNNGVLTSNGNYISVWNSNGMLVDQSNMTLVPTITSQFQLGAGIAAAGGSALKMNTAGSDLTTPETGAWEPNNGRLAYTPSLTRKRVLLSNDVAPTNGQIPIGNGADLTMATITGANGITVANGSGSIIITNGFRSHTIFTPTTGGTVALVVNQYNIINPSGALLALTVNLPSSPSNNDVVYIKFTQTISTVTYGNGTVVDGISGPISGGLVILAFDSSSNSWY